MYFLKCPNFFFSTCFRHMMIKNQTRLFKKLSSVVEFSKSLCQGIPSKAENSHALSQEQYFSKNSFLDICQCAFKYSSYNS